MLFHLKFAERERERKERGQLPRFTLNKKTIITAIKYFRTLQNSHKLDAGNFKGQRDRKDADEVRKRWQIN